MSIGLIGAGASTLFQLINKIATPASSAPAAPAAPATAATPTPHHRGLHKKIQDAVTAALNDPTNASADPNAVIKKAITDLLTGKSAPAPATTGTDPATQQAQLTALLQAHGVNPSQYQADIAAAVSDAKSATGGTLGTTTLAQAFSPGNLLDAIG